MQTRYFDLRDTKGQQKEIEDKIAAAAKILRDGGLVAIPTETVKLANAVVATGPIVLLYPFLQKYFVRGITIGAVKG